MPQSRAVVRIDHRNARVLQLDGQRWMPHAIRTNTDYSGPHRNEPRSDREYFSDVCDALIGMHEILVTGPHTAQADFRRYISAHRPSVERRIIGWEAVDDPAEGQLAAVAGAYFHIRDGKRSGEIL